LPPNKVHDTQRAPSRLGEYANHGYFDKYLKEKLRTVANLSLWEFKNIYIYNCIIPSLFIL